MPGSTSGSGTVTSFRTAISGATFDLTLAQLAAAYPADGGSASVELSETARLSGLSFFDSTGNPLEFGTLTGASGRLYDANGVHTTPGSVPEPPTWAMMMFGFGTVGVSARRRARIAIS